MSASHTRHIPRADDDRALKMLAMRAKGYRTSLIGERFGLTDAAVRTITNRIYLADLRESGEPEPQVRKGYW